MLDDLSLPLFIGAPGKSVVQPQLPGEQANQREYGGHGHPALIIRYPDNKANQKK